MALNRDFVMTLKTKAGPKDFVLFAGLLDLGHQQGLISIENEVVETLSDPEKQCWVVRSTGRFKTDQGDAIWSAHGDASPANSQMHGAYLRHAETRAAARMLRMATNVGMTAYEELGLDHDREQMGNGEGERTYSGPKPAPAPREQSRARGSSAPVGAAAGNSGTAAGPLAERDDAPAVAPMSHWCEDCGQEIQGTETKKGSVSADVIAKVSVQRWGKLLCHSCGRKLIQIETANVPAGQIAA